VSLCLVVCVRLREKGRNGGKSESVYEEPKRRERHGGGRTYQRCEHAQHEFQFHKDMVTLQNEPSKGRNTTKTGSTCVIVLGLLQSVGHVVVWTSRQERTIIPYTRLICECFSNVRTHGVSYKVMEVVIAIT
jgi:hypothetical protein